MRGTRLALTLAAITALAAPGAHACSGQYPPDQWRAFRLDQDRREREFIAQVTRDADRIFVGELTRSDAMDDDRTAALGADFRVEHVYKGEPAVRLTVAWRDRTQPAGPTAKEPAQDAAIGDGEEAVVIDGIQISCWPRDAFDEVDFAGAEGYRFLVYVRDGRVLRASRFNEGPLYLLARDEVDLLPASGDTAVDDNR